MSLRGMREFIGAESPGFPLDRRNLSGALAPIAATTAAPQFTDHCFTGDYPMNLTDYGGEAVPRQLSLLAEVG